MYILCSISAGEKEEPLGQIRLSIEETRRRLTYIGQASRRGQGLGAKMILMAEEKLRESRRDVNYYIASPEVKYARIRHLQRYLKNAGMMGRIWNSILSFLSV